MASEEIVSSDRLEPSIFDYDAEDRESQLFPTLDVPEVTPASLFPSRWLRSELKLPQVDELSVVRHFMKLSQLNISIDTAFYPLGSCTMKYNPKLHEKVVALPGLSEIHPFQSEETLQGLLSLLYHLEHYLGALFGFDAVTLAPAAGAQGELVGLKIIRAYQNDHGGKGRDEVLVPDAAHGTNPATAAMVGARVVQVPSNALGEVDLDALRAKLSDRTLALMITNPNTLGLFDTHIQEVVALVHKAGGLVYYDGANANAILGKVRPGDLGFDVAHINLHKTFSTPHGGGGPGAGPVGVKATLAPYLPSPWLRKREEGYGWEEGGEQSIGRIHGFFGNVGMAIRAFTYIRTHGLCGLTNVTEQAVLNANYVMKRLKEYYYLPYERTCQHEFVISAKWQKRYGVRALDIAKRLIDYGFHPPTIYFPLIVEESLMIEPTETESKRTLDQFCDAMIQIAKEAETSPHLLHEAPHVAPVRRLDEAKAVRELTLCHGGC